MLRQSGKTMLYLPLATLVLLTSVQNFSSAGVSPADWADSVSHIVGGAKGGKAPVMQGEGTETAKVDEAVAAATEYLAKFKF